MGIFNEFAATPENNNWEKLIRRERELDIRPDDVRSPFARDYTRILHSRGYRRMKHKTQVFFNIDKDHICTRMEHVAHVESVSGTIAGYLGLNTELTKAISIGHDIGHAPFGHQGERVLDAISSFEGWLAEYCEEDFVPEGELKNTAQSCKNRKIYGRLETAESYVQAVIDYISGMTDRFAIKVFNELLKY